ncbi:MAG: hypothetical protein J6R91_01975 [Bacteroidaceae bacterium]|nr:hypothetical protein [Bacteroidaceae bacterium]
MKFKFINFFMMAMAVVLMSACEDDDNNTVVPEPKPEELVPFAMTYVDFITPEDIQILSADTTRISVSSAFASKMGIKHFKNRAVTIWRSIGTVPFIRIITDAQESNGEIILTTKRGEFSDMFENVEMSLVSDIYVDHDHVASRTIRAGSGETYTDVSGKYQDEEGVYHPAVVIMKEGTPLAKEMQRRTGSTKNYYTAEELVEQNATFDILNIQSDFKFDHQYPKEDDEVDNTGSSIHLKGKVGVSAKLSAYANVNVGWFKLKKFEAGVKGEAGVSAKLSVALQKEIEKKWETEIMPVGGHVMVFWVGFVPVPLVYESSINHKTKASANATVELLASAKYKLSFEQGCLYEHDKGWKNVSKETKSSKSFNFDGIRGSAKLEAMTGIFYEMGIYLGGSIGPEFSFGPSISAEAEVAASADPNEGIKVEAGVGAYAGLSGEIGAKIKLLGYNLAKWETSFDVFKLTLFEGNLTWYFTEEKWNELEAEWNHVMNQGSEEWDWKESRTVIPYAHPEERSMNF